MQQPKDEDRKRGEQEAVPGVRAPLSPAGTEPDADGREGPGPGVDVEPPDWGGEGGAGAYRGAPTVSERPDEPEAPSEDPRRARR